MKFCIEMYCKLLYTFHRNHISRAHRSYVDSMTCSGSAINLTLGSYYTFHVVNHYDILQFSETCLTVSFHFHNKFFLIKYTD